MNINKVIVAPFCFLTGGFWLGLYIYLKYILGLRLTMKGAYAMSDNSFADIAQYSYPFAGLLMFYLGCIAIRDDFFKSLWVRLSRKHHFRWIFRNFGFGYIYNRYLKIFPRIQKLNEIIYRCKSSESVSLAYEILEGGNVYPMDLVDGKVKTFADIGCNVGLFTIGLAAKFKDISGILIDADKALLEETSWHLEINKIQAKVFHCCVGTREFPTTSFYKNSNISTVSTAFWDNNWPQWFKKRMVRIIVPSETLTKLWSEYYFGSKCDLVKIDIEGSEFNLLEDEKSFFSGVKYLFVEWHKYAGNLDKLISLCDDVGLKFIKIIEEGNAGGVAFFKR